MMILRLHKGSTVLIRQLSPLEAWHWRPSISEVGCFRATVVIARDGERSESDKVWGLTYVPTRTAWEPADQAAGSYLTFTGPRDRIR